jgi:uncharacterized DUF497 family protein
MHIAFDSAKDAANLAKHGISLALAAQLEWDSAITWADVRRDYGERRMAGLGYIGDRLFAVVFVDRADGRRIVSLRKANQREERIYAKT